MNRRIVIKTGTSSLTYPNGRLNLRWIESFVRVVSDLKNSGVDIVFVTSGAVSVGVSKLGLPGRPTDLRGKQAAAAVGQCELMAIYDRLFLEYGHTVAQVLLTPDVVEDEHRKANVENTFEMLLEYGAIPIVNENDTVATDELDHGGQFGDNDTLSAIVATLVHADLLVLVSDIDGLYTKDPRENEDAKLISVVYELSDEIRALAGGAGSARGTGGMRTKLQAAEIANSHGIDMRIVNHSKPELLYDVFEGKHVGTEFVARRGAWSENEGH